MTTKCYQKAQKDCERYQNFADEEKEKKKSINITANEIKIFLGNKSRS